MSVSFSTLFQKHQFAKNLGKSMPAVARGYFRRPVQGGKLIILKGDQKVNTVTELYA